MTAILFPCEPFEPRKVDDAFADEHEAAQAAGFNVALVDHPLIAHGEVNEAVRHVRLEGPAVYRGWMLTTAQYGTFHHELARQGVGLVNSPAAYAFCHQLPNNYAASE